MAKGAEEAQIEFKTFDKQNKRLIRENKDGQNRRISGQLVSTNAQQNATRMRSLLRDCDEQEGRMKQSADPADYKRYIKTPSNNAWAQEMDILEGKQYIM